MKHIARSEEQTFVWNVS